MLWEIDMKFTKMQGIGNDYVYINCFDEAIDMDEIAALTVRLSDRHFGVGSDGVILICPSDKADFRMRMFNGCDGSEAEMCGNGIRCVGKYVHDKHLTDKTTVTVETLAGIKTLGLNLVDGQVDTVRVDMGEPVFACGKIPVATDGPEFVDQPVQTPLGTYRMTAVSMGNPHAVTFVEDVEGLEIEKIGPLLENHPLFPKRANIEFIQVVSDGILRMRVWERGSGETLACGTGACASIAAAVVNGRSRRQVKMRLLGGELELDWNETDNHVYMTGPARFVFDGELL